MDVKSIPEHLVAGMDEAGAGPLCGDLFVAAVILNPHDPIPGLADSKKLTASRRQALADMICQKALAWTVVQVCNKEIDRINIFQARMRGFERAAAQLRTTPGKILIDGNRIPPGLANGPVPVLSIIKGDALEPSISAASILAKVHRDRSMEQAALTWPGYGFEKHKGYPTKLHLQKLRELGPCPIHRRSYKPVAQLLAPSGQDLSVPPAR